MRRGGAGATELTSPTGQVNLGLEGVVSKSRECSLQFRLTNDCFKGTCRQRETLAVAGCANKENKFDGIYHARSGLQGHSAELLFGQ